MRRLKAKNATKIVATFGAGLASTFLAPSAEGAIISLTPTPGSVPFNPLPVPTFSFTVPVHLSPGSFSFGQYNDGIGKTFNNNFGLIGFRTAPASQTITIGQNFYGTRGRSQFAAGTSTFGFLTSANQVGWIRINFGGLGNPVTYLAAAYNDTPGGSIHSGSTTAEVPEPTSLALAGLAALALGARARRKRES
jgi:PEP-CTERM motif